METLFLLTSAVHPPTLCPLPNYSVQVAVLLKGAFKRVEALLQQRERELHALAAALLENETLTQVRAAGPWGGRMEGGASKAGLSSTVEKESTAISLWFCLPSVSLTPIAQAHVLCWRCWGWGRCQHSSSRQ